MWLFGKSGKDATEKANDTRSQVREWTRKLRGEMRQLDRQMRSIENEERKVTDEIKKAGKRGDVNSCRILAKEVVRSRKARERLLESKAQLNSVSMSLQQQAATMRVAGSLEKSTDVMQAMGNLVKVSEISTTMTEMSREMMKLGLIDEMVGDAIDSMDPAELEEESAGEVLQVMSELAADVISQLPDSEKAMLPQAAQAQAAAKPAEKTAVDEIDARLKAL
uniref:Charged multivesicular body protein 3 n=1 Tax=Chromera velia CCMP2878 TaxID=1169474 RepID=A0A0G4IF75_9ALVE|eukprot:Cvel_2440.t1-p1 / transcript=Cvel_2440.t1 / gene=Cvel_2440 / organism=Chromera_velia_CCMP2878 / gene_product=Charged multivesicular body protein 3, putative / transcript_product=Charged multivesicular body protein 3, putative / location=Cvel_scaffold95:119010-122552(+) / protein_length=221 / sequence_SO=supercontig / SO=protein_coding / is_pseudo=false